MSLQEPTTSRGRRRRRGSGAVRRSPSNRNRPADESDTPASGHHCRTGARPPPRPEPGRPDEPVPARSSGLEVFARLVSEHSSDIIADEGRPEITGRLEAVDHCRRGVQQLLQRCAPPPLPRRALALLEFALQVALQGCSMTSSTPASSKPTGGIGNRPRSAAVALAAYSRGVVNRRLPECHWLPAVMIVRRQV